MAATPQSQPAAKQAMAQELIKRTPNPFECKAPWTAYEIFKAILLGPVVLPVRLLLALLMWFFMSLICKLAVCGGGTTLVNDRGCLRHEEPLPPWRRAILWPCRLCVRTVLWCCGFWWIQVDDRRTPVKKFTGQIVEGTVLEKKTMTVEQAKSYCLRLDGCKGFSFQGAESSKPVEISFMSEFALAKEAADPTATSSKRRSVTDRRPPSVVLDDRSDDWTSYRVQPNPGIVACAPHINTFDAIVMATLFPPLPSEVGKIDLVEGAMGFVLGSVAIASQGIFVRREEKSSREACKDAIAMRAGSDWKGPPTMIFPEGTCTNGKALICFKLGPFLPGKPVLPCALEYPWKNFEMAWTGRFAYSMGMLIVRSMLQFVNHCKVTIFEPYVPSEEEIANPQLYANNVRQMLADHLNVPCTEHSYADNAFSLKAIKENVANDFQIDDLKHYGITTDKLVTWLKGFKDADKDDSGFISQQEFAAVLSKAANKEMQNPKVSQQLFELYDTEQTGFLSYRECIQALAMMNYEKDATGRDKMCFVLCNPGADGLLPKGDLQKLLESSWALDPAALKQLMETCPETMDSDAFCKWANGNQQIALAIFKGLPEEFQPTKTSPAFSKAFSEIELSQAGGSP